VVQFQPQPPFGFQVGETHDRASLHASIF
jgi:hypothetical protein